MGCGASEVIQRDVCPHVAGKCFFLTYSKDEKLCKQVKALLEVGGATVDMYKQGPDACKAEWAEKAKRCDIVIVEHYKSYGHSAWSKAEYTVLHEKRKKTIWIKNFKMDMWNARCIDQYASVGAFRGLDPIHKEYFQDIPGDVPVGNKFVNKEYMQGVDRSLVNSLVAEWDKVDAPVTLDTQKTVD
eukprot:TRINITY_DN92306_c0_g1_i1.p1 TRINITY_DN92306_c0_g1~~TRINITY_DN92306_c0_g1_i1.p1  ORF type:complete len:186 (-),score=29.03 TRINITY_DN92306_c0_g1_i1:48-605(-)